MGRTHPNHPNAIIFEHPLIQHKLTSMRATTTGYRPFRALIAQIAGLMVFEFTRTFPTNTIEVQTPLETCSGQQLSRKITVVPILRAGLGMAEGIMEVMPEARVGHLGMVRNHETLQPEVYLEKLPADLDAGPVVLVDPMLATGGSAIEAIKRLKEVGATDLRLICLVAAPEGLRGMERAHPEVTVYSAAVDRELDGHGYIRPGLGDAGDRMYGTV
ncbi:MAG: uracil phosphoribosyltransferase [Planctomycetota bacterium]